MLQKPNWKDWPVLPAAITAPSRAEAEPRRPRGVLCPLPFPLLRQSAEQPRTRCRFRAIGQPLPLIQDLRAPGRAAGTLETTSLQRGPACARFTEEDPEVKHGEVPATHLQSGRPHCNSRRPGSQACLSPSDPSPREFSCLPTRSRQTQAGPAPFPGCSCAGISGHGFNARALCTRSVTQLTSTTPFPATHPALP